MYQRKIKKDASHPPVIINKEDKSTCFSSLSITFKIALNNEEKAMIHFLGFKIFI